MVRRRSLAGRHALVHFWVAAAGICEKGALSQNFPAATLPAILTAALSMHGRGRMGIEAYYTGRQSLDDNPYLFRSRAYVQLGAMGELVLGKVSLFVNAENLLNVRQTHHHPLLLRSRAPTGAWMVAARAPTDGFVLNGGVRFRFGEE
jgi:iron complex outermembrane receptor protein